MAAKKSKKEALEEVQSWFPHFKEKIREQTNPQAVIDFMWTHFDYIMEGQSKTAKAEARDLVDAFMDSVLENDEEK